MEYPDSAYRGFSASDCICQYDGHPIISDAAFQFDRPRDCDGLSECSINWNDDDESLVDIARRTKKATGEHQFKAGAGLLSKSLLNNLKVKYLPFFDYERRDVDGTNRYHGNLLINEGNPKPPPFLKRRLQGELAQNAEYLTREELDQVETSFCGKCK